MSWRWVTEMEEDVMYVKGNIKIDFEDSFNPQAGDELRVCLAYKEKETDNYEQIKLVLSDWENQVLGMYYLFGAADPKAECLKNVENTLVTTTTDKGWYVEKNDFNEKTKSLYVNIKRPMTIDNLETLDLEEDTEYYYSLNGGVFPSATDETPGLMFGDVANTD